MQSDEVMLKRARVRAFMDQHELEGAIRGLHHAFEAALRVSCLV